MSQTEAAYVQVQTEILQRQTNKQTTTAKILRTTATSRIKYTVTKPKTILRTTSTSTKMTVLQLQPPTTKHDTGPLHTQSQYHTAQFHAYMRIYKQVLVWTPAGSRHTHTHTHTHTPTPTHTHPHTHTHTQSQRERERESERVEHRWWRDGSGKESGAIILNFKTTKKKRKKEATDIYLKQQFSRNWTINSARQDWLSERRRTNKTLIRLFAENGRFAVQEPLTKQCCLFKASINCKYISKGGEGDALITS